MENILRAATKVFCGLMMLYYGQLTIRMYVLPNSESTIVFVMAVCMLILYVTMFVCTCKSKYSLVTFFLYVLTVMTPVTFAIKASHDMMIFGDPLFIIIQNITILALIEFFLILRIVTIRQLKRESEEVSDDG